MNTGTVIFVLTLSVNHAFAQITIGAGPDLNFMASVDDTVYPVAIVAIGIGPPSGPPIVARYQYTGVTSANTAQPTPPNFLVVTPSIGTTSASSNPAEVRVGLNPTVLKSMAPGGYTLQVNFSTVDQSPPATTHILASLTLSRPPAPVVTAALNAASFQPTLAPGALISIFGSNFGPPVLATQYDDKGLYPTAISPGAGYGNPTLGNTMVTIGGIAAPLTYVSAAQINALVPYGVAGMTSASVVVTCYDQSSVPTNVPVQATSPRIFTATQNGTGQGAILNVSTSNVYTYNSVNNPAPQGSPVVMYATGFGAWDPPIPDGEIALTILNPMCSLSYLLECTKLVNQPLSLTIGGKAATVFYAGTALYEPWSLLQINAYVPADAPSGQQPVVLRIGQYDDSQQNVTMAVK